MDPTGKRARELSSEIGGDEAVRVVKRTTDICAGTMELIDVFLLVSFTKQNLATKSTVNLVYKFTLYLFIRGEF